MIQDYKVQYPANVYKQKTGKSTEECLLDSIYGKDILPLENDYENWSKVTSVHCPHCGCELRISLRALEELLCKDSDSFYGEFKEYCHECGERINFPVFSFDFPTR